MDASKEKELFEQMPVPKAILKLALPSVAGQIILVIYNMADTFFVAQTGSDAMITAVTVCMPAFLFLSAIANLFGVGGSSAIARALGDHDRSQAGQVSAFALWGCALVTLAYSLAAFLLMDVFVDLLGGWESSVHPLACSYLLVTVVLGGLATSLNALLSHLIRAEGDSFRASLGIILGGILNMVLDPLFMFVILEPGHEALGAAIATALSNGIALGYFLVILGWKRGKTVLSFRPGREMLAGDIPRQVISTGLPACLMTLFENISFAVLDHLLSLSGTAMQAGIGVAKKVNMLAHCIVRGMSQGVLPLIGYNYASRDRIRMHEVVRLSMLTSVAVAGLCTLGCLAASEPLIGIFIQSESTSFTYGAAFLRILCLGAPFSACAYTCISFFQAVGRGNKSLLLAVLRKGLLDIPLMFLLQAVWPLFGVVWATPVTDAVCCGISLVLYFRFMQKHASPKAVPVAAE